MLLIRHLLSEPPAPLGWSRNSATAKAPSRPSRLPSETARRSPRCSLTWLRGAGVRAGRRDAGCRPAGPAARAPRTRLVLATAVSALRTAVAQLDAARAGVSLHRFLGAEATESVELYATSTALCMPPAAPRRTSRAPPTGPRAPGSARSSARRSTRCPRHRRRTASSRRPRPGWQRVGRCAAPLAPRPACWSTVTAASRLQRLPVIAGELAQLGVGWFEEPVSRARRRPGWRTIARQAPLPVAGGESGYGNAFFDRLLDTGAVSIIMPDIKHCGGVGEAVRVGRSALRRGGAFSLHSPSGPISLLASAHATAAVPGALPLEHAALDEVDWRADLVTGPPNGSRMAACSCRRPRASAQPSTGDLQSAAASMYGLPDQWQERRCWPELGAAHEAGTGTGRRKRDGTTRPRVRTGNSHAPSGQSTEWDYSGGEQ